MTEYKDESVSARAGVPQLLGVLFSASTMWRVCKRLGLLVWMISVTNPGTGLASEYYGVVSASVLNVRVAPDPNAEIKHKLERGSFVSVVDIRRDWYQVGFLIAGKVHTGWVFHSYVRITRGDDVDDGPESYGWGHEEEVCDESTARLSLSVDDANLDCKKAIFDDGYDRCRVEISYSIQSSCDPVDVISKTVACSVELRVATADGYVPIRKHSSESNYESIYSTYQSGSLEVVERVQPVMDVAIGVRVESVSCELW